MYVAITGGLFLLRYLTNARLAEQLYWLVLLALFLFSAFRFEVGCDWSGYLNNFRAGASTDYAAVAGDREVVWWWIQVAFNRAGLPYPSVNVLTSAIFFAGIHTFAKRQPDRLGFLVLLFPILIINMPMSGIRQAAAIGLFCFALNAIMDGRPVRFVAWLLLASTIHSSALVFLLLLPFTAGRLTPARAVLVVMLALPGLLLMGESEAAEVAFSRYVDSEIDAAGAAFRVGLVALSGLLFFVLLRKSWAESFPRDLDFATIAACLMITTAALLPLSTVIADRFAYYLLPMQAMILTRIKYLNIRNAKLITSLPYFILLFVFIVWSSQSWMFQACYVPYQTWIFGFPENVIYIW